MEDKWLKQLHDMMDGFETDAPRGLWEAVEARLDSDSHRRKGRRITLRRTQLKRLAVAAAAIAAAIITGTWLLSGLEGKPSSPPGKPYVAAAMTQQRPARQAHRAADATGHTATKAIRQAPGTAKAAGNNTAHTAESTATPHDTAQNAVATAGKQLSTGGVTAPKSRHGDSQYLAYSAPTGGMHDGGMGITLGVFASGGIDGGQNLKYGGSLMTASCTPHTRTQTGTTDDYCRAGGDKKKAAKEVDHRQPVRFGLTVAFGLNNKLSVETGLTYAYLSSDIRSGKEDNYYTGSQSLHYVGIPVRAKYTVASWKRLKAYASTGVLAEKCVSGKSEKEYIIGGQTMFEETEKTVVKPLQLSVNAALGVQLDITQALGIYAEPGVSYYFDNGSAVKTIYKDKPLNFSLNVGLRLTVK